VSRPGSSNVSPNISGLLVGHVLISGTPTGRFLLGAIKGGPRPLHSVGHSIDLNTL
jgi:hypothetical protein